MFRILSCLCASAVAVLLGVTAVRYAAETSPADAPPDSGERLVIARPDQNLGEVAIGSYDVEFSITNTGTRPRRIIGDSGSACGPNCCWVVQDASGNGTIGPGETFVYRCRIEVKRTGDFDAPLSLFLDDDGLRTVTLRVRGVGIPRKREAP